MKDMTIGQRLNTTFVSLILLVLVSIGLELWVGETRSNAVHRSDQLSGNKDRIYL